MASSFSTFDMNESKRTGIYLGEEPDTTSPLVSPTSSSEVKAIAISSPSAPARLIDDKWLNNLELLKTAFSKQNHSLFNNWVNNNGGINAQLFLNFNNDLKALLVKYDIESQFFRNLYVEDSYGALDYQTGKPMLKSCFLDAATMRALPSEIQDFLSHALSIDAPLYQLIKTFQNELLLGHFVSLTSRLDLRIAKDPVETDIIIDVNSMRFPEIYTPAVLFSIRNDLLTNSFIYNELLTIQEKYAVKKTSSIRRERRDSLLDRLSAFFKKRHQKESKNSGDDACVQYYSRISPGELCLEKHIKHTELLKSIDKLNVMISNYPKGITSLKETILFLQKICDENKGNTEICKPLVKKYLQLERKVSKLESNLLNMQKLLASHEAESEKLKSDILDLDLVLDSENLPITELLAARERVNAVIYGRMQVSHSDYAEKSDPYLDKFMHRPRPVRFRVVSQNQHGMFAKGSGLVSSPDKATELRIKTPSPV